MPTVSNTSPLLNLAIIDHLFLIPEQFGCVHIPPGVLAELKVGNDLPGSAALQAAMDKGWLITQSVQNQSLIQLLRRDLHQGESEAIALAVQISAETLLLDEKEARQTARALGLRITGVLGILLRGWREGSVTSMQEAIERLRQDANFRISPALLAQIQQVSGE
jgi:predicted nucleic acid-binding protein